MEIDLMVPNTAHVSTQDNITALNLHLQKKSATARHLPWESINKQLT